METLTYEDIAYFLTGTYFGKDAFTKPYYAASSRAYSDMCRTLHYKNEMGIKITISKTLSESTREQLKQKVSNVFEIQIKNILITKQIDSQEQYDEWHFNLCTKIRNYYHQEGFKLTYGQVQKWLNMTIKYLYINQDILKVCNFDEIFKFLHIPLDDYVFKIAKREFKIEKPKKGWSRLDNYENEYLSYQKQLREKITKYEPLRWEFKYWLKEARGKE